MKCVSRSTWCRLSPFLGRSICTYPSRLAQSRQSRKSVKEEIGPGEWIVDHYPAAELILNNRDKWISSLVKRVYSSTKDDAEALLNQFQQDYANYTRTTEHCCLLEEKLNETIQNSRTGITIPTYEFHQLRESATEARKLNSSAKSAFLATSALLPNELSDIVIPKSLSHFVVEQSASLTDPLSDTVVCSSFLQNYMTGKQADFILDANNTLSAALAGEHFLEVTVPSTVRKDVLDKLGVDDDHDEGYELQTKSQLHQEADHSFRDVVENRKEKPEDHYVYKLCGLTDVSMALLFLRQRWTGAGSQVKLFSSGNKYRFPDIGKPCQSRVVGILIAEKERCTQHRQLLSLIELVHSMLSSLGVESRVRIVRPHLLFQHEAVAVEFFPHDTGPRRVLCRFNASLDFLSRRIMAFSQSGTSFFSFTSCMIDLTEIAQYLHRSEPC